MIACPHEDGVVKRLMKTIIYKEGPDNNIGIIIYYYIIIIEKGCNQV